MDEFNELMNSITNVYLAGMGLPKLKAEATQDDRHVSTGNIEAHHALASTPIDRDSPLYRSLLIGGRLDIKRRLDAMPWGYERRDGKSYGDDPVLPI